ncbi:MAG: HNH endonuclease signature motif containing protein [Planctomycetota bacterium]
MDALLDDYTRSWEARLATAFDLFRTQFALDKQTKDKASPGEYWTRYGQWTRVNSDRADTIQRRHEFFALKMLEALQPEPKDPKRLFGALEREIIYARDKKRCVVCGSDVLWDEAEYHHVNEHAKGGRTELANGVLVHGHCHPKGEAARAFAEQYKGPGT